MNLNFNYVSVPDDSPASFTGGFVNDTAIYVAWAAIPVLSQNGVIQRYEVAFRKTNSSEAWKTLSVDSKTYSVDIVNLKFRTLYDVKVAGKNSVGQGPYSVLISIRTDLIGEENMEFLLF